MPAHPFRVVCLIVVVNDDCCFSCAFLREPIAGLVVVINDDYCFLHARLAGHPESKWAPVLKKKEIEIPNLKFGIQTIT